MFTDFKAAYNAKTYKEAKSFLHPQWKQRAFQLIRDYNNIFRGNLYLEIQLIDQERMPSAKVIGECLRSFDHQKVATADSHYVRREDAEYQRILLCSGLRTNMQKINESLERGESADFNSQALIILSRINRLAEGKASGMSEEEYRITLDAAKKAAASLASTEIRLLLHETAIDIRLAFDAGRFSTAQASALRALGYSQLPGLKEDG